MRQGIPFQHLMQISCQRWAARHAKYKIAANIGELRKRKIKRTVNRIHAGAATENLEFTVVQTLNTHAQPYCRQRCQKGNYIGRQRLRVTFECPFFKPGHIGQNTADNFDKTLQIFETNTGRVAATDKHSRDRAG
jgi:hypothetical protein